MRRFILLTLVLSLAVIVNCQRDKSPLKSEYRFGLLPILKKNEVIRISPEMDAVWPGGDHLIEFQYDWKWGGTKPEPPSTIESVTLTHYTGVHKMYDDGNHMDGQAFDGIWGYYVLIDTPRAEVFSITYEIQKRNGDRYFLHALVVPFKGTPLIPKLTYPVQGASIHETMPTFTWEPVPGADEYGIIIWDKQPMPETFEKNVVFHKEFSDPSVTSFSLQEIQLTPGKTYWWVLWAYDGPGGDDLVDENDLLTSSMNWGRFEVRP